MFLHIMHNPALFERFPRQAPTAGRTLGLITNSDLSGLFEIWKKSWQRASTNRHQTEIICKTQLWWRQRPDKQNALGMLALVSVFVYPPPQPKKVGSHIDSRFCIWPMKDQNRLCFVFYHLLSLSGDFYLILYYITSSQQLHRLLTGNMRKQMVVVLVAPLCTSTQFSFLYLQSNTQPSSAFFTRSATEVANLVSIYRSVFFQ